MANEESISLNSIGDTLEPEHLHAVSLIKNLRQSLIDKYAACPDFVIGPLRNAFIQAFRSTPRPLLIYIHHNESTTIDSFCSNVFCTLDVIEFLRDNYVVWPWDMTDGYNRYMFFEMWRKAFPDELIDFTAEKCPKLIGVTRVPSRDLTTSLEPLYKCDQLLVGRFLTLVTQPVAPDNLITQLISYKQQFEEYDREIPFNFIDKTGDRAKAVVEISKYLSLNDAIMAFSPAILPQLSKHNTKLPLIDPSRRFIKKILPDISREYILSLHIQADYFQDTKKVDTSEILSNIKYLTIYNLEAINQITDIRTYLPNLTNLCIYYDEQIEFIVLCRIFNVLPNSIKKFKLYGSSIPCTHKHTGLLFNRMYNFNASVESFVLNVEDIHTSLPSDCAQRYETCILRTICDFIRIMSRIESMCIIVNIDHIEALLDVNEWKDLVNNHTALQNITLKVKTNISENTQLAEKFYELKEALAGVRESIRLQITIK